MKIYVGNLSYSVGDEDIRAAFAQFGTVDSADVIMDRSTGRSKGFGFVEMSDATEAKAAIEGLNGKDLDGRAMNVNEARPKTDRPQRSSYRY
jgi:RNA recognition motif-containing protein